MVQQHTPARFAFIPRCPRFFVFWRFRFSCPVCVTSVHVRASSVLRLVVHPSEGLFGNGRTDGEKVVVPSDGSHEGRTTETLEQDIDVDVRGIARYALGSHIRIR